MITSPKANILSTVAPHAGKTVSHVLGALAAISFVMLILSAAIRPAAAQEACVLHDVALQQLSKAYGEHVAGGGLTADGKKMFELLTSEGGSWTLMVTDVHGNTCMLAGGDVWLDLPAPGDRTS